MNARLGNRRAGEDDILGDFCVGKEAAHKTQVPNQDLLMELCWTHRLAIANTCQDDPIEKQVTFHEVGTAASARVSDGGFNMLDLLLVPLGSITSILELTSDLSAALASHHFPVLARIQCTTPASNQGARKDRIDFNLLKVPDLRKLAVGRFDALQTNDHLDGDVNTQWQHLCATALASCEEFIPTRKRTANKPWISDSSLELIADKREARTSRTWDSRTTSSQTSACFSQEGSREMAGRFGSFQRLASDEEVEERSLYATGPIGKHSW